MEKLITKHITRMLYVAVLLWGLTATLGVKAQSTTDSVFLANSSKVLFKVNKTDLTPADRQWMIKNVAPTLRVLGPNSIIIGRSAASPEGPYENNKRLALGRRETIKTLLQNEGIDVSRIRFDMAVEEYELLAEMMRQKHDADYEFVRNVVDSLDNDDESIKKVLMAAQGGKLFSRLKEQYFSDLRAVRIMVYVIPNDIKIDDIKFKDLGMIRGFVPEFIDFTPAAPPAEDMERREVFSIKTNLAEYAAYVPKYGWCPLPNAAVEYYPRHGHFAWGAYFDCPWWIGNTTNHKYFELRNYTLESRYYFRNSNKSYTDGESIPNGQAAFKGFYISAYANAFLYQIGCNKDDGWVGEGAGAGLGLGYVIPLGKRNQHWRLEIGAQFGFFRTKYDPFVYGCPVEKIEDGLYYYDYTGDPDLFKTRQYRFTWLGPTRAGITLTYDLLYRRIKKKGASFKHIEKGGAR